MQAADTATIRFDPNGQPQALQRAVAFLKVLGHEGRLELLCHMIDGAQSVGALTQALGSSQPAVSQHLMRLRAEGHTISRLDLGGGLGIPYTRSNDAPPVPMDYGHLMRLRAEGLVRTERRGKSVLYSIAAPEMATIIAALRDAFCTPPNAGQGAV